MNTICGIHYICTFELCTVLFFKATNSYSALSALHGLLLNKVEYHKNICSRDFCIGTASKTNLKTVYQSINRNVIDNKDKNIQSSISRYGDMCHYKTWGMNRTTKQVIYGQLGIIKRQQTKARCIDNKNNK